MTFLKRFTPIFAVTMLLNQSAFGQPSAVKPEGAAANPQACSTQIQLFCKAATTPGEIAKCLIANQEKLTSDCQQELKRFARAAEQASESGGGALSALSQLNSPTPPFPVVSYEGRYVNGDPTLTEHRASVSAPLFQTATDYFAMSVSGASVLLGDDVTIGTRAVDQLYRAEIGSQYNHQLGGGRRWGLRASVGSASDELFNNLSDTSFSFNINYGYPSASGKGYWLLTAFLSNNAVFGNFIPIPGVVYLVRTKTFSGMFGFPLVTMQWTPSTYWAHSFSLLGPTLNLETAYGSPKELQTFVSGNYSMQNFILAARDADDERLTLEEKKVAIGLRKYLFGFSQAELQAGYAFDRMVYIGEGIRNMRRGSTELESDWFIAWSLKAAF